LNATIVIKNAYFCDDWIQRLPVPDVLGISTYPDKEMSSKLKK
jgi:hypothetical protein